MSDLLTHRSGIVTPGTMPGALVEALKQAEADRRIGPDEWIKRVGALPLAYEPGTRFNYGNSFDVLGVSGCPRLRHGAAGFRGEPHLFKPLGMKDSGFFVPADKMARLAVNYGVDPQTKKRIVADPSGPASRWAKPPAFTRRRGRAGLDRRRLPRLRQDALAGQGGAAATSGC